MSDLAKQRIVAKLINETPGAGWGNMDAFQRGHAVAVFNAALADEGFTITTHELATADEIATLTANLAKAMEAHKRLRDLIQAIDAKAVWIDSVAIGGGGSSPHPWHEEWLYHARRTLSELEDK